MRFGNISPSSTHTTGPHDMPNATTNRLAATSAIGPAAPARCGWPSITGAVPKITAIVPSVTAMPIEPISSSGLRPILSISAIAMSVVSDVRHRGDHGDDERLALAEPTACHSTFE